MKNFIKSIIFISSFFLFFISSVEAADITACGTISTSGTYILQNDISSDGTCITLNSNSVTLDLNGHSITYNDIAGDNIYGVLITWNKSGIRITNGTFIQGPGNGYLSSGIYSQQGKNLEFDHLTFHYQGDNNSGINQVGSGISTANLNIHDNFLYPNGTKRADPNLGYPTHYGVFSAIRMEGTGGAVSIKDNYIEGKGYMGISFGYSVPLTQALQITGNTIKMASPVRDGYAIYIGSSNNADIGFNIANNTIIQSSGRGIMAAGNINENSPGPGLGEIHNNYIEIREPRDAGEYEAAGNGIGIQLRFGAHNIQVYENTVKAYAGLNACPKQFPTSQGDDCKCIGIKVAAGQYAINNKVFNNDVVVESTDSSLIAIGLYAIAVSDGTNEFYGNTVTSNSVIVSTAESDGAASNFLFRSNNFIKGADPKGFYSIKTSFWTSDSNDNVYLDNNWIGGASLDNALISGTETGGTYSFFQKWFLNVYVDDGVNPVAGALVEATSSVGGEIVQATTDNFGNAQLVLTDYKRYGTTVPATTNYINHSPHSVNISKDGYENKVYEIDMDSSKSLSYTILNLSADSNSPAAPINLTVY